MTKYPHQTDREELFSTKHPYVQRAWDATSLSAYMQCPRKYYYSIIEGWRPKALSADILFGKLIHECTGHYDAQRAEGIDHETALRSTLRLALTLARGGFPDPVSGELMQPLDECDDEYKCTYTAVRTLVWWADETAREDALQVIKMASGRIAVELSFRMPLGIETPDGDQYLLCGHFDELVRYGDEIKVRERKTTKQTITDRYWRQFAPNVQVDTYDLAARTFFPNATGVIIEAYQTAKTLSRVERRTIHRTRPQAEEWLREVQGWIKQAEADAIAQEWPMNTAACMMHGGCVYQRICTKDPGMRARYLKGEFQVVRWNPIANR